MAASLVRWLESYSFGQQLLILALAFDPIGAVVGYLLAPTLGVSPILGVGLGLTASATVPSAWILRHAVTNDGDATEVA